MRGTGGLRTACCVWRSVVAAALSSIYPFKISEQATKECDILVWQVSSAEANSLVKVEFCSSTSLHPLACRTETIHRLFCVSINRTLDLAALDKMRSESQYIENDGRVIPLLSRRTTVIYRLMRRPHRGDNSRIKGPSPGGRVFSSSINTREKYWFREEMKSNAVKGSGCKSSAHQWLPSSNEKSDSSQTKHQNVGSSFNFQYSVTAEKSISR